MGIRIEKKTVVYESVGGMSIEPEHFFPNGEKVREYLKKNPFPETGHYTAEDLLCDTQSTGSWWLPDELTDDQKSYIVEMTDHFL